MADAGAMRNIHRFWPGNLKAEGKRDHFEDIGINMWIILKLVSNRFGGSVLADRALVIMIKNFGIL
jgi:hypothetical protein